MTRSDSNVNEILFLMGRIYAKKLLNVKTVNKKRKKESGPLDGGVCAREAEGVARVCVTASSFSWGRCPSGPTGALRGRSPVTEALLCVTFSEWRGGTSSCAPAV